FTGFYTKRLRRLFPALIFTLLAVLAAGYFLFNPSNFERLGQSSIFASLSVSNFFFWTEAGYFDPEAGTKPLLHMWSLSLEEQFYLFWPLVLVLIGKYLRKATFLIIALLAMASLFFAEWYLAEDPSAAFFLIPFRMFEFLLGALCIWVEDLFRRKHNALLEGIFLLGIFLILYSSATLDKTTPMPGLYSMVPVLGSMLVVIGGPARILSWILKNKPIEYIGKSSYSIYLVHWPIIVFYKYWTLESLTPIVQVVIGVGSIILGLLMWKFIENTFRYRKVKRTKIDPVWFTIPTLLIGIVSMSGFVWKSEGVPSRYNDQLFMPNSEILKTRKRYFNEYTSNTDFLEGKPAKGHILIMGNSHSIDLIYALRENGYEGKITALRTLGKCFNFGESSLDEDAVACKEQKEENLANDNWAKVDAIYLHDNWPNWDVEGLRRILKRIRTLSNAPIFVFGPKMTYKSPIPEIVRKTGSVLPDSINAKADAYAWRIYKTSISDATWREIRKMTYAEDQILFINVLEIQGGLHRDKFEVISRRDLKFLYFDTGHFTKDGARQFGAKMKKVYPYLFDMELMKIECPDE
ncbi:MAG: acyltransferase family protein, partial [Bacteroidota bacterium]